ncbi:MAG TPA: DUF222 domain-containing protein [Mycobacteriales bacterium]
MAADVEDLDLPAVEREITTLAGHLAAATCRFLSLLAVFDTGGGWRGTGMRSCAQWLSWRCGLSPSAAGEQLRVAHALTCLPAVRGAFAAGQISYSKARALTRVATTTNEQALVSTATACTASQLDRLCRGIARARSSGEILEQAARASFTARWEEDGTLRFSGRLPAEEGAVLLAALAAVRPDPITDPDDSRPTGTRSCTAPPDPAARAARSDAAALLVLAEHALTSPPAPADGGAPVRLVIHTTDQTLTSTPADPSAEGHPAAVLDAGPAIPLLPLGPDTLRRLTCQALLEPATHPDQPPPTTQHRFATSRQRRALLARDGGCAFPGCRQRRHLHAHHRHPWSDGGPTTMQNLLLICAHHHRLVHEGRWRLHPRPDARYDAIHPDGHVIRPAPQTHGAATALPATHPPGLTPTTVTRTWTGEHLDLDYAVSVYTQPGP